MPSALASKFADRKRPGGRLLIIGYGNPLRSDDGAGWQIADQIAKLGGDSVKVFVVHQLTPELAEPISDVDFVVFIDASYEGQPGSWTCETIRPETNGPKTFSHHCTPVDLLNYTSAVFNAKPRALLISVAGGSFGYGGELSPSVAAIVPKIVAIFSEWWDAKDD